LATVGKRAENKQPYVYGTKKGNFQTFVIPKNVNVPTDENIALGKKLIRAFRTDGLLQIEADQEVVNLYESAYKESKNFFANNSLQKKEEFINDSTYSGYIGSGDEATDGKLDGSEIFTVTPDIDPNDKRVKANWPCHGPVPWPSDEYKNAIKNHMSSVGKIGDNLLKLIALGLDLDINYFYNLAQNGWHHMRVLRFPAANVVDSEKAGKKITRGIGSHTDYGLLVIASQDDIGGLYIRPPVDGEIRLNNWQNGNSMAGKFENEDPWTFVEPVSNALTIFPGDMLQLMTNGYLLSTPHKVSLHPTSERFALAYFHEPAFETELKTIDKFAESGEINSIEYGTHFTNMFMRGLPERSVTKKLIQNNYKSVLDDIFDNRSVY
jgi:isopenicillin N synthase-like dioxygenase